MRTRRSTRRDTADDPFLKLQEVTDRLKDNVDYRLIQTFNRELLKKLADYENSAAREFKEINKHTH
jgi:hypothetical protein